MSLFQCEVCGCRENTATCNYWVRNDQDSACKGRKLCSACDPNIGKWHGEFRRLFLPIGMFRTASNGNLEHIETGSQDTEMYAVQGGIQSTPETSGIHTEQGVGGGLQ